MDTFFDTTIEPLDGQNGEGRGNGSDKETPTGETIEEGDGDNCSICLHPFEDRTIVPPCSHEFCFKCLLVWTDQSRRCPLCTGNVGEYLIHNIRSRYDYQKHFLQPLPSNSPVSLLPLRGAAQRETIRRRRRERVWGRRERSDREEMDRLERSIEFRRWVYENDLYAKHVASNTYTRFRPFPTPAQFAASQELMSRATSFIRRELHVWPNLDVEFLTTFTLSIMKSIDIRSESAIKLLAEFLDMDSPYVEGERYINAEHFAHEVYSYLRSPFKDIFVYDSVVQYDSLQSNTTGYSETEMHGHGRSRRSRRSRDDSESRSPSPPARQNRSLRARQLEEHTSRGATTRLADDEVTYTARGGSSHSRRVQTGRRSPQSEESTPASDRGEAVVTGDVDMEQPQRKTETQESETQPTLAIRVARTPRLLNLSESVRAYLGPTPRIQASSKPIPSRTESGRERQPVGSQNSSGTASRGSSTQPNPIPPFDSPASGPGSEANRTSHASTEATPISSKSAQTESFILSPLLDGHQETHSTSSFRAYRPSGIGSPIPISDVGHPEVPFSENTGNHDLSVSRSAQNQESSQLPPPSLFPVGKEHTLPIKNDDNSLDNGKLPGSAVFASTLPPSRLVLLNKLEEERSLNAQLKRDVTSPSQKGSPQFDASQTSLHTTLQQFEQTQESSSESREIEAKLRQRVQLRARLAAEKQEASLR